MFANTLTLTIDGAAKTLVRVNQDNFGSEYSFKSASERITVKIRHTQDNVTDRGTVSGIRLVNRHNVMMERIIYATPSSNREEYTATVTLREGEGNDPAELLKSWEGFNTLLLTLDNGLVVGEN